MLRIKYIVDLASDERDQLLQLIRRGKPSARKVTRARILLKADEGLADEEIARLLNTGLATVGRVRKRFVEEGLDSALNEKPRPGRERKLDGKQEARFVAEVCCPAPPGHARWTLRLLAERVVELELADSISHETVRQVLKKTNSSRGKSTNGVSPKSALSMSPPWKTCWICTRKPMIPSVRSCVSMKCPSNLWPTSRPHCRPSPDK